jgi:hypothetical protein
LLIDVLPDVHSSDLLGIVSDSGLVDAMSVSNALIQLALRIEREGVVVSKHRALGMEQVSVPSRANSPLKSARGQAIVEQEDDNSVVDAPDDCSEASYDTPPTKDFKMRSTNKMPPRSLIKSARGRTIIEEEEEDENSVVDTPDDCSEASYDSPPTMNSKKRSFDAKRTSPPAVTPQRAMQKPRVTSTPPHMVHGEKQEPSPRVGTSIRESLGHFLAEQVETLCIHPNNESEDSSHNMGVRQKAMAS